MGTRPAMEVTAQMWAEGARGRDGHAGRHTKTSRAGWSITTVLFPAGFPLSSGRCREGL